jgi:hypothetical protein
MAILGGSPLGLIGVRSSAIQSTGMSSFNGGQSRNINVNNYNTGTSDKYPITDIGNNKGSSITMDMAYGTKSLFTGQSVISPYGNLGKPDDTGTYNGVNRNTLHNNDIYDTSLLNIIEKLSPTKASLRPADFAYLKDVGVFPNNRLMIARRFLAPQGDNIFGKSDVTSGAMAILASWKPQTEDFLEINFGENWIDANADFTDVLNSLGKDFTMGMAGGIGSIGSMAADAIPLPGFTESIQRYVLAKIGVLDENTGLESPLPSGNPNLIKMAKRRKTIGFSEAGSGLKCSVTVKMTCEWEQKFISGIDPTIVWQDIIATILRFGTSHSDSYGLSKQFEKTIGKWIANPGLMMENLMTWISAALSQAKDAVVATLKSAAVTAYAATTGTTPKTAGEVSQANADTYKTNRDAATALGEKIMEVSMSVLKTQIQKYKIEIEGIGRALSGAPSTPWHITLGNPLRPIFCAGDMYMESDVKLTFGPTLAFNDLPSNIIAEFTLTNARPWGLQEIMAKFNAGSIRVSAGIKSADATNGSEKVGDAKLTGGIAKGSSASNVTSTSASNTKNGQPAPSVTNAAVQQNSVGPMTQAQVAQSVAQTATTQGVLNFTNNFVVSSNLPPQTPGISDLKPISTFLPTGLTTTGVANISVSGLSGLSTTKEGKSGERIISDANSTLATAQEVVSKSSTFGLS